MFCIINRIIKDDSGVSSVEMAILAPVFLLLTFGIIEFSMIFFAQSILESSTSIASRLGKTGYNVEDVSREEMIYDLIKNQSSGFLDVNEVEIEAKSYGGFSEIGVGENYIDQNNNGAWDEGESFDDVNGNGVWDADLGIAGLGGANDVVIYTVRYPWVIMTPVMGKIIGKNGVFTIITSVVVKNEPYNSIALGS